jgi:hypothetical protein
MNRNQKIAIGCGGAGCLGLIVVIIAVGVIWYLRSGSSRTSGRNSNYNFNINSNSNANVTGESSAETNENTGTSSSMSDDDRHKLYHAASATKDTDTMVRVWKKLGLTSADGTPNENYTTFARDHIGWLFRNSDFIQEVNTEEKARAYVNAHIDD